MAPVLVVDVFEAGQTSNGKDDRDSPTGKSRNTECVKEHHLLHTHSATQVVTM